MLKYQTLFHSIDKVKLAIERLQAFEPPNRYYLAFSGGKDSIVLYDLAIKSGVGFDAHYSNTGIDPPELVKFIRKNYPAVIEHKPKKSFFQLIPTRGFPTRQVRWCCEELKEKYFGNDRVVVTGIRWAESSRRKKRGMVEQCYRTKTKSFVHPIIDWDNGDIWNYIKHNELPYCCLYDQGFKRIGCILCPMSGKKMRKLEAVRYPNYVKAYKLAFRKLLLKYTENESKWALKWKNEDELFDWWIADNKKQNEAQINIVFE